MGGSGYLCHEGQDKGVNFAIFKTEWKYGIMCGMKNPFVYGKRVSGQTGTAHFVFVCIPHGYGALTA